MCITIACGKRAGLCVIEVCSSLFIFITWDRAKVLIARLPQAKRYAQCRGTDTVLRTLARLLAAHSCATPKQSKEPKKTTRTLVILQLHSMYNLI
jgi:hypothetical protein